jgi:hypothetical protein
MEKVDSTASKVDPATNSMEKQMDKYLPQDNEYNLRSQPLGDYTSLLKQMDQQLQTLGYAFEASTNQSKDDIQKIKDSNEVWQAVAPVGLLNMSKKNEKQAKKPHNHKLSNQFY